MVAADAAQRCNAANLSAPDLAKCRDSAIGFAVTP